MNSVGALHHLSKGNKSINSELLTCIVGGDNQHYHFDDKDADKLCEKLLDLKILKQLDEMLIFSFFS